MCLGLLVSGNLGLKALKYLYEKFLDLRFVFTDKNSNAIIDYCRKKNIEIFIGNPRIKNYSDFVKDKPIDVLISVNYIFIIEKPLIEHPARFAFNIHGSLLPKYRGRTPHVWAIINNETETGVTAHLIEEGCDTGDIIKQVIVPIEKFDTGGSLLIKFEEIYIQLITDILSELSSDIPITTTQQDNSKATYFGKRTPADGIINWKWQKERIYNWIRAQSYPYPGAFSFINGKKVIIDEVKFSDHTYTYNMINGLILNNEPLIVKTPNGAIEVTKIREGKEYCLKNSHFDSVL